jgi:hypothetical protein
MQGQNMQGQNMPGQGWNQNQRSPQNQRFNRQQSMNQNPQYIIQPEGWVRVAYDFDQDGTIDAVEYIYSFDLEQARAASRQRAAMSGMGQMYGQSMSQNLPGPNRFDQNQFNQNQFGQNQFNRFPNAAGFSQAQQLSGTIADLQTKQLVGMNEAHQIAKLQTRNGQTKKVDLGPISQVSQLNLEEGDDINVTATQGTINQRPVYMARQISNGSQTVQINMPRAQRMMAVQGQIQNVRTTNFRGYNQDITVANVQLQNGQTVPVILGPSSQLQRMDLSQGEQVSALVSPTRLNGQFALLAKQVNADGQTIDLSRTSNWGSSSGSSHRYRGSGTQSDND